MEKEKTVKIKDRVDVSRTAQLIQCQLIPSWYILARRWHCVKASSVDFCS